MKRDQGRRFDFFQLVSLLQRRRPDRAEVGHLGNKGIRAGEEFLRFRPHLSFGFPPRDVERTDTLPETSERESRLRLELNFGGLYGSDSPLPSTYTEYLLQDRSEDIGDDKEAVRDFLDIFHHRLYSLHFRTWEKYRYHATFRPDGSDDISKLLFALVGLGTPALARSSVAPSAPNPLRMLRYGGLTMQRPRSSEALRAVLQDQLGSIPVAVRQFVARRITIPEDDRTYLGRGPRLGGRRSPVRRLGRDTVIGTRLLDRTGKLRIAIGPVPRSGFDALLPGTPMRRALDDLVHRTAPRHLVHDVEITLLGKHVPGLKLTRDGAYGLGWTSWLTSRVGRNQPVLFGAVAAAELQSTEP